jgi:hypothetical protein
MAIVAVFEFPDAPVESYEKVFEFVDGELVANQPSRRYHLCYRTGDVGFVVVDIWDDEESFAAFGEDIRPAIEQVGLDAKPLIYPLQARMGPDGVRTP